MTPETAQGRFASASARIFLGGIRSHSPGHAGQQSLVEDFRQLRELLGDNEQSTARTAYFSYRAGPLLASGDDPRDAWCNRSGQAFQEPLYASSDTTDFPLETHTRGLDTMIRALVEATPRQRIDLVGFSLGGIIALDWLTTAPDYLVRAINQVILISCPVGGVTRLAQLVGRPGLRRFLPLIQLGFGTGRIFDDLVYGSPVLKRLRVAPARVRVLSLENANDPVINGRGPTGCILHPRRMGLLPLGLGVAASGFLPADQGIAIAIDPIRYGPCARHRQVIHSDSIDVHLFHASIVRAIRAGAIAPSEPSPPAESPHSPDLWQMLLAGVA